MTLHDVYSNYSAIILLSTILQIKKKNDVIRRIQADLRQIEKFSEENMKRVQSEAEKQEAADIKTSDGKKQRLLQELQQLKTQIQNLITEHRESEQELRRVCICIL